jgi:energy-coupling factor transport system permease protein
VTSPSARAVRPRLPRWPGTALPRPLHPGAWWAWALGCATAASTFTNPLLLLLLLAVLGYVVAARRTSAPWARAFVVFLKVAGVVLLIRTVAQVVLGPATSGTLLFRLPEAHLPDWAAGVTLGGPVTVESILLAASDGLRLGAVLLCIGAANALANPKRLLSSLPSALHEVGVVVVVAITFTPQLVEAVGRVRAARRLRGRPDRGIRSLVQVAMPVLEDALDRSLSLAAAMDSRGYGRRASVSTGAHRLTGVLLLLGLAGVALGVFGLLGGGGGDQAVTAPRSTLAVGVLLATAGLRMAGHRTVRTRYRPDPFTWPEWTTLVSGVLVAGGALVANALDPVGTTLSVFPLAPPPLPPIAATAILCGLAPAFLTPPPTTYGTGVARRHPDRPVTEPAEVPA